MGRGRQKAKHTKIARELKAYSPAVDYNALERELTGHTHTDDEYAKWTDSETEDDDYTDELSSHDKRA